MRKLLLTLPLAATASVGGGSAEAAPCYAAGGTTHSPDQGGCLHWADFSRSSPGQVGVYLFNATGNWQNVIAGRRTYFNAAVANVKVGPTTIRTDNICAGSPWAFQHNVCIGPFTGEVCGPQTPNQWAGCAQAYISYNTLGQLTPHLAAMQVRIKDPSIYIDGTTRVLTDNDRAVVFCHEVLGHSYGMNHYPDAQNPQIDPGPDSCLYYVFDTSSTVLYATIVGQIDGYHAHNDPTTEYAGIGAMAPLSPKALKMLSVLRLKRMKGVSPDGKRVYIVPGKPGAIDVRKLPKGPLYVAALEPAAYRPVPQPLWQQFKP